MRAIDPVIGYKPGQRVLVTMHGTERMPGRSITMMMAVTGTVETVVVPKAGQRYAVVAGDDGLRHEAFFDQLAAV